MLKGGIEQSVWKLEAASCNLAPSKVAKSTGEIEQSNIIKIKENSNVQSLEIYQRVLQNHETYLDARFQQRGKENEIFLKMIMFRWYNTLAHWESAY